MMSHKGIILATSGIWVWALQSFSPAPVAQTQAPAAPCPSHQATPRASVPAPVRGWSGWESSEQEKIGESVELHSVKPEIST